VQLYIPGRFAHRKCFRRIYHWHFNEFWIAHMSDSTKAIRYHATQLPEHFVWMSKPRRASCRASFQSFGMCHSMHRGPIEVLVRALWQVRGTTRPCRRGGHCTYCEQPHPWAHLQRAGCQSIAGLDRDAEMIDNSDFSRVMIVFKICSQKKQ